MVPSYRPNRRSLVRLPGPSTLGNVVWRPFIDPPWRVTDAILNTLLYVPFGLYGPGGRYRWFALPVAASLSIFTEAAQLFSHSRVPSMTDVTCNVAGAFFGLVIAAARDSGSHANDSR